MAMRDFLNKLEPNFHSGGKYEKYYPVYEMIDTIFYSPGRVTQGASHVRDAVDMKRVMTTVWWCAFFPMLAGMYIVGHNALIAMADMGISELEGWRGAIVALLAGYNPESIWHCFIYGAVFYVPIYATTFIVGGLWEVLFAVKRGHEVNEGFFVTSILFSLTLPATIPLWQVALGISFGVVIGKEIFGGTGKNLLNPALTGRALLIFCLPRTDFGRRGLDGRRRLQWRNGARGRSSQWDGRDRSDGADLDGCIHWQHARLHWRGIDARHFDRGVFLLVTRVASWRIMLGTFFGMVVTALLFNAIGSETNPLFAMPWHWHLVLGGFAFGMVYMATDPVSAAMTDTGRFAYGALIGFMCVLIRVVNPAFPEGMMLAILFANLFAPLFDYSVVRANIKRRLARV